MEFITKLNKFMHGRYGIDELHSFIFKIYISLIIIDLFVDNKILILLELFLLFIMIYRFLSKNCYQRRKENKLFTQIKKEIEKPFLTFKKNITDKENVYIKCGKCKKILKLPLPYERGIKHTKCPNCKKKMTILVLKKQKIEIIKR